MKRTDVLKLKMRQINVWVIAGILAVLLIIALFNQKFLDSDYLSFFMLPLIYYLGLITIFALYSMTVIILVNYVYYSLIRMARSRFYDDMQKDELIDILKNPEAQGNYDVFRERVNPIIDQYPNFLSEIVSAIIPKALAQPFMLEQYFRAKIENISNRFADGINTINLVSNLGPVVGFFGTLLGLIQAFAVSSAAMQTAGMMTPEIFGKLQTSIMIAIITSLYGISLKIIGSILRHLLISKLGRVSEEMQKIPVEVLYE